MSRDFDPKPGQWFEDLDREEIFKVVNVDPDEALVRVQWLDGEYQDLDIDAWHELDLELAEEPEGWVDDEEEDDEEEDEDWDDEDEDEDEDEDWDDEDDLDDDDGFRDRE